MQFNLRKRAVIAGLGAAVAACAALSACAIDQSPSGPHASEIGSDIDLTSFTAFGRGNPECLAWTDWHRTCSRLSTSGDEIHCNVSEVQVPKSQIFCLATRSETRSSAGMSGLRSAPDSYNRFCTAYRTINGEKWCFEREPERPFGGLRISELRHPYCEVWGNDEGQFCTENPGSTDLPSCKEMETAPKPTSALSCFKSSSEARDGNRCVRLARPRIKRSPVYASNSQIIPILEDAPVAPVANVYCEQWGN